MSGVAPNNDVGLWGRVGRAIGTMQRIAADQAAIMARYGAYGEQIVEPLSCKQHKLADEGSYFLTRTPTPNTGIIGGVVTAFVDTTPYLIVTNNNAAGGKNLYLDYLKLNLTAVGGSGTDVQYVTRIDKVPRFTSGGSGGNGTSSASPLQGPVSTNAGGTQSASGALVYLGALTAVAASPGVATLANGKLRTAIGVVNDSYRFNFGGDSDNLDGILVSGAAIVQRNIPHPPVCLPPGTSFLLHLFATAQAGGSTFEVELGHVER